MLFSCDLVRDPEIRKKLDLISEIKSLAFPPLCLPNIHSKSGLESPPQFVAATKDTIVPMLSAPAMNCGMSIFITNLMKNDFSEDFLKKFAEALRETVGPRRTRWQILLNWLGISSGQTGKYDLSKEELESIFLNGAKSAVKKYGLSEKELEHIEYDGSMLTEEEKLKIDFASLVPRSAYTNGRHEMGYNFGGNHFLEFHVVEKILDGEKATRMGLKEGQIILFYHGGGGHATYHLGRYFARREKNTRAEKFFLFFLKFIFHFSSWEGIKNFRSRWQAYFSCKSFPEIPLDSPEGKRLMASIKIALNYGYAFRVALLRRINDALPKGKAAFFWDAAHNSITEEKFEGEDLVVHRQDAMRVFLGKPVMITGSNNTLGCIGIGSEGGSKTLWSITPSATKVIDTYKKQDKSKAENPPHATLVSKRQVKDLIRIAHITSEGLFDTVEALAKEDIFTPVAYIRPLASIKGH